MDTHGSQHVDYKDFHSSLNLTGFSYALAIFLAQLIERDLTKHKPTR